MQSRVAALLVLSIGFLVRPSMAATPGCTFGTYQPHYGGYNPTHQAIVLTDPAGEQTAKFDLAFGGTLVSLNYGGSELIWGDVTGAQVQPNWFTSNNLETGLMNQFYNPQTGGDNALGPPANIRGNPTHGGYCTDANTVTIISATTDYLMGRSGVHSLYAVYSTGAQKGALNPFAAGCPNAGSNCAQYASPYSVTTVATFVPNLSGATPHYYLQLTQTAANASISEVFGWTLQLAVYLRYDPVSPLQYMMAYPSSQTSSVCVPSPCPPGGTPLLIAGGYVDASHTSGLAAAVQPSVYWNLPGLTSVYLDTSTSSSNGVVTNSGVSLWAVGWPLGMDTANRWTWYLMAGSWSAALAFAQSR